MNQVRKCIITNFYKTKPDSRIRASLSIIDYLILKITCNVVENFFENIHDLRENVIYMFSFEKMIRDEQQTINSILIDDNKKNHICYLLNGCESK